MPVAFGPLAAGALAVAALAFPCALLALAGFEPVPLGGPSACADTLPLPEYQVKAAFLFNFIKFVEWPGNAGVAPPFTIGILGKDPFGKSLEAVQSKDPKWRSVAIRHFHRVEEVRECNILFIGASERRHLPQILKQLQKAPVLTLGDMDGFTEAGGMINLVAVKSRVTLEINLAAARNGGLKVSSQLLKLARITREEE